MSLYKQKNSEKHDVSQNKKNNKIIEDKILKLLEDFVKSVGINSDQEYAMARDVYDMHIPGYLNDIASDLVLLQGRHAQLVKILKTLQKRVLKQQKILAFKIDTYIKG
jgi:hypothetical protein